MQRAQGTLKQNLVKFQYTEVINEEVNEVINKPSRSH